MYVYVYVLRFIYMYIYICRYRYTGSWHFVGFCLRRQLAERQMPPDSRNLEAAVHLRFREGLRLKCSMNELSGVSSILGHIPI